MLVYGFSVFFVMMIGVSRPVMVVAVGDRVVKAWEATFVCWSVEEFGGVTNVVVGNRDEESKSELVED